MKTAHYFATRSAKVIEIREGDVVVQTMCVSGKTEARKIAKACGAKTWNF